MVEDTAQEGTRRLAGGLQDDQGIDSWPFSVTTSTDGRFVTANFTTGAAQFALEANAEGGRLRDTSSDEARLAHDEMH